jgi:RimJ/RimL family protein N-acetyltransferase
LIAPDVERDAELSLEWLRGEVGKSTLTLMGNVPDKITEPTLELEKKRVVEFLENNNEYNWMIECDGKVVGSVWADLEPSEYVPAPAVHIMIGDPEVRSKGIGPIAMKSVIEYLVGLGHKTIYTRHLVSNIVAGKLLKKFNFEELGEPYSDEDGLKWQNAVLNAQKETLLL